MKYLVPFNLCSTNILANENDQKQIKYVRCMVKLFLPIPRFTAENEFYRFYFNDKSLWLDVSNVDNDGLKTSEDHYFIKYISTFNGETHVNIYDWIRFSPKMDSDNQSLITLPT